MYRYHLRKSQDQTASTINIEDQTLSERDMMIKELKEVNHALKKCLEKSKKVEDQVKENLDECRNDILNQESRLSFRSFTVLWC